MRHSTSSLGLLASFLVLLAARTASADNGQRYPVAYVDRPLTLPGFTLSPDVGFDATQIVEDPSAAERTLATNLALTGGFTFGITEDVEVRASIGTLRFMPAFEYLEPRLGLTYRFVGAESFNMGIRAEVTALTLPGEAGARVEASLPLLIRLGSSARLDMAPGALFTLQEKKATTSASVSCLTAGADPTIGTAKDGWCGGINVPVSFAFQMVEVIHIGARTSAYIVDLSNPGESLTIPLGFFLGISLGSERPIFELDPYFTWTEFSRPGAKFDNDKVNIEKFSAGAVARLYLFL